MIKILFICHGNICRSTMAEYVMKHLVKERNMEGEFYINSAATSYEEIGNPVHFGTRRKLEQMNIYCGDHRATRVEKSDYGKYDYLIVMDTNNLRNLKRIIGDDKDKKVYMLLDFCKRKGESIADPWYTGNFDAKFNDVLDGCEGLLKYIKEK